MSLIEGIGDEVTHFFLTLFLVILVSIAWWSTNITDQRQFRTVVLLDRRRRRPILRRLPPRRVISQTEISSIQGVNLPPTVHVVVTEGEEPEATTSENSSEGEASSVANPSLAAELNKPVEAGTSTDQDIRASTSDSTCDRSLDSITEAEVHSIIETMDADRNDVQLRLRRLAHFDSPSANRDQGDGEETTSECSTLHSSSTTSFESEPKDNTELRNRANAQPNAATDVPKHSDCSSGLVIKLKFINDDIRVVDGRSEELLGDFKKRHFQQEEADNKVVKLIFNGQVLKQDNQTLQGCGLFDQCVVHCLIHPKRSSDSQQQQNNRSGGSNNDMPNTEYFRERIDGMSNFNNNNQGIDWDLGNFLFALISFILLAAWYFRYVYAHLYTVTATVGLILITGIFTIVLVGMCFPDNLENVPIPTIRIARTERIEVQGQPATT